jgi:hypothetical protein
LVAIHPKRGKSLPFNGIGLTGNQNSDSEHRPDITIKVFIVIHLIPVRAGIRETTNGIRRAIVALTWGRVVSDLAQ